MAGKSNTSATFFAQKKLLGKAHTSNLKVDGEEVIGSNIQAATSQLFGEKIPTSPTKNDYDRSAAAGAAETVEYIPFILTALTGTTYDANTTGGGAGSDSGESGQSSGPHTYKFVLPANYETNSGNPKKGAGLFDNNQVIHETLGGIQLVPPFFSQDAPNPYIVKIYKDDGSGGIGTEIPLLDNIDWNVDYYNGILFLQDYDANKIPAHARAYAYIGKTAEEVIAAGGGGGGGGSIDGSGAANRIAFWSDSDTLTSDADLTWNGTTLTATSTGTTLNVQGNTVLNGTVVVNQSGVDKDFRVETQNKVHALQVDGGTDMVLLFSGSNTDAAGFGSSAADPDPKAFRDTNFFVSGSIGSRGTTTQGTSVFGGDVFVSGTIHGIQSSNVLISDDPSLANARVITAGDGISISTATPRQIKISTTRTKKFFDITGSHAENHPFDCHGLNFANVNYNPNLVDVFYNGVSMRSGSAHDYVLHGTGSIKFKFQLLLDDIIQVVVF